LDEQPRQEDHVETDAFLAEKSQGLRIALMRYFQRRGIDPAECEDLTQEVFLRIVRSGKADELERFEGYVFTTAASVLADRARRRSVRHASTHVQFDVELHGDIQPSADEALIAREGLRATSLALMKLPERTRTIFILKRVEGFSNPEIATRLGLSISAVEKHMVRATRHILSRAGGLL
jgi:RNA polymerase sigma-70 factor (ECF subfamily)